jgi:AcrR family transcriptional regulator
MPYRRTDNVARKLAARHNAILQAARDEAAEGGMAALQIAAVAERAGIAAGTVYRYFPSKTALVAALIAAIAQREIDELRRAAEAAPGPLSALAGTIATFAARAMRNRRLAWAMAAEPIDAEIEALRLDYRRALAGELQARIEAALAGHHLPEQDAALSARALVGALLEGAIGPLAPAAKNDKAEEREAVQMLTLLGLRTLGVLDARARGLVVQIELPLVGKGGG